MNFLVFVGGASMVAASLAVAEPYYRADPARLDMLQAERCAGLQNQARLIRRRMTSPVNLQGDVARMKSKLQAVEASAVRFCPAASVAGIQSKN